MIFSNLKVNVFTLLHKCTFHLLFLPVNHLVGKRGIFYKTANRSLYQQLPGAIDAAGAGTQVLVTDL